VWTSAGNCPTTTFLGTAWFSHLETMEMLVLVGILMLACIPIQGARLEAAMRRYEKTHKERIISLIRRLK
jgi:hypothetical protein